MGEATDKIDRRSGKPAQGDMPADSDSLESLLTTLEQEERRWKRKRRRLFWFLLLYAAVMISFTVYLWRATGRLNPIFLMIVYSAATASWAKAVSDTYRSAARKVSEIDDPRALGSLLEALEMPDREIWDLARQALIRLLPNARASDASLLTPHQTKCLYHVLKGTDTQLIVLALRALEQIGDRSAISYVERLASGEGAAAWSPRTRKAAQDCLPYLYERAAQEKEQLTLLRASGSASTVPDILLRPAKGTDEDPQQLLRADQQE